MAEDKIVSLIPEAFFFHEGDYSYFGAAYGFFVKTVVIENGMYQSSVILFDIDTKLAGSEPIPDQLSTMIAPKVCATFRGAVKASTNTIWERYYDPARTRVAFLYAPATNEYLKNVQFDFGVKNYDAKNVGEDGYCPSSDYGDFILQSRYNYVGEGKNTSRNSFLLDTVSFFLDFVDWDPSVLGYIYTAGQWAFTLYSRFASGEISNYYEQNKEAVVADNEANITTNYVDSDVQIAHYGGLAKRCTIIPKG